MRISALALAAAATPLPLASALDNGVAATPPMGFNSYMAPGELHNEAGLGAVADFFVQSGLHAKGYTYVNTDEGWELGSRDAQGALQWDPKLCVLVAALPATANDTFADGTANAATDRRLPVSVANFR